MIHILNVEPDGFSPQARAILSRAGELTEMRLTRSELLEQLPNYEVLIVRFGQRIDREMIAAGEKLKAVVTAATGVNHIDVEYARTRGVAVLSLQGEYEFLDSVSASAEHTWALLLALLRRIPHAFASVRTGSWDRDLFRGSELYGKRLGIVGLGRIGRKVARYAQAFGMRVAAYDPYAPQWIPEVTRCVSLSEVCRNTDVLSIHVPLVDGTVKLIGQEQLQRLAARAVLVNTARGEVLDEQALLNCLQTGHLAGAALDVICGENDKSSVAQSALIAFARAYDNLIITPHIAGATCESMEKTEVFMAAKLVEFLQSRTQAQVP